MFAFTIATLFECPIEEIVTPEQGDEAQTSASSRSGVGRG